MHALRSVLPAQDVDSLSEWQQLSEALAEELYRTADHDIASTQHNSAGASHNARIDSILAEFTAFLQQLPSSYGKSLLTCAPRDLQCYITQTYIKQNRRLLLDSGMTVAAPSSVTNAISAISMAMKGLGRTGEWDSMTNTGNPCSSHPMRQWKLGYLKELTSPGYSATGAKELTCSKVCRLLGHLHSLSQLGTAQQQVPILRDEFAFSLLYMDDTVRLQRLQ